MTQQPNPLQRMSAVTETLDLLIGSINGVAEVHKQQSSTLLLALERAQKENLELATKLKAAEKALEKSEASSVAKLQQLEHARHAEQDITLRLERFVLLFTAGKTEDLKVLIAEYRDDPND